MMVDRPVSKGYENLMTLEDSTTPATSVPQFPSFGDNSLPDVTSQQHHIRPPTAVKPYSNETVWLSVKTLDGEPSIEALIQGNELDPTKTLVYIVGLYSKCLGLCGTVTKMLKRRSSAPEQYQHSSPPRSVMDPINDQSSQSYSQYGSFQQSRKSHQPPLSADTPLSPDALSTNRTALQRELEAFRASLPEWARNVDKYPGDDPTRAQRYPIYHVMVLQIAWHAAMLVLWFPVVLGEEGGGGGGDGFDGFPQQLGGGQGGTFGGGGHRSSFQSDAYAHCLEHAFKISTYLDAMGPESGLYPGYYLAWILYHPAVMLSLEAHRQGGDESHEGVRVKRMAEKIIGVMRELARRSFLAGVIADNTEKILGGGGWEGSLVAGFSHQQGWHTL